MTDKHRYSLVPFDDWDAPVIDPTKSTLMERVNLYKVPLGTAIHFTGDHHDSLYYCKIDEYKGEKAIKIWFKMRANCAISLLKYFISGTWPDMMAGRVESGIMAIGYQYVLPQFDYGTKDGKLYTILNWDQIRTEVYRKIMVQLPGDEA